MSTGRSVPTVAASAATTPEVVDLVIEHTDLEGTAIWGTSRGDGSAEVLKAHGWRWSRALGAWYLPATRGKAPQRSRLEASAAALRDLGFTVEFDIDETLASRAALQEAYTKRAEQRSEHLEARAAKQAAIFDARHSAGTAIVGGIPLGQPAISDRLRSARNRAHNHFAKAYEAYDAHKELTERAKQAAAGPGAAENPITVANRIKKLTADVARLERAEAVARRRGAELGEHARYELARAREDLTYWTAFREAQIASGVVRVFGKDNVAIGDFVKIGGSWHPVLKTNAKTVVVPDTWGGQAKAEWHKVTDHRPAKTGA